MTDHPSINTLTMVDDKILFQFMEKTVNGVFTQTSDSGLIIRDGIADPHLPRWARVVKSGPKAQEKYPNDSYILIEPLGWMNGMKFEEGTFWVTIPAKLLLKTNSSIVAKQMQL